MWTGRCHNIGAQLDPQEGTADERNVYEFAERRRMCMSSGVGTKGFEYQVLAL